MELRTMGLIWMLGACAAGGEDAWPTHDPRTYPEDERITLDEIQVKGTHNSYHVEPLELLHPSYAYTHPPVWEQLEDHGVRQLEFDLHWRDDLGFVVHHLTGIDEATTCATLVDCLLPVRDWSRANPGHVPLLVWIEPKSFMDGGFEEYGRVRDHFGDLEALIADLWPRDRRFQPDDLRGDAATLRDAVRDRGWPTLGELRGKTMFAWIATQREPVGEAYAAFHPDLVGATMFLTAIKADDPNAALMKQGGFEPTPEARRDGEDAETWIDRGLVVTANVDAADATLSERAQSRADAVVAGVHFLATDFLPGADRTGDAGFDLGAARAFRCNPVTAGDACSPEAIEHVDGLRPRSDAD